MVFIFFCKRFLYKFYQVTEASTKNTKTHIYNSFNRWNRALLFLHMAVYSLLNHTFRRSSYRTALSSPLDTLPGFILICEARVSVKIKARGDLISSSSSSLVLDFLSIEEPHRLSWDLFPTSPIMSATEMGEGGA